MDIGTSHVGVASIEDTDDFTIAVYPNPSSGNFNIAFELKNVADTRVLICDQKGNILDIILDEELMEGKHLIKHTPSLPSGVYHLILKTGNYLFTTELVIIN